MEASSEISSRKGESIKEAKMGGGDDGLFLSLLIEEDDE